LLNEFVDAHEDRRTFASALRDGVGAADTRGTTWDCKEWTGPTAATGRSAIFRTETQFTPSLPTSIVPTRFPVWAPAQLGAPIWHACGIDGHAHVLCAGSNGFGELGNGRVTTSSSARSRRLSGSKRSSSCRWFPSTTPIALYAARGRLRVGATTSTAISVSPPIALAAAGSSSNARGLRRTSRVLSAS
jgi:hypothetical protein